MDAWATSIVSVTVVAPQPRFVVAPVVMVIGLVIVTATVIDAVVVTSTTVNVIATASVIDVHVAAALEMATVIDLVVVVAPHLTHRQHRDRLFTIFDQSAVDETDVVAHVVRHPAVRYLTSDDLIELRQE